MTILDFSDRKLIDKYYREKFTIDISNYFVVDGWQSQTWQKQYVTGDTVVRNLYKRTDFTFDGEPAIYMGAGPWCNVEQNYEFSGIFAYMFIADRCIRNVCGDSEALRFCREFNWPIFVDAQPYDAFDIVAVLKEASLAPVRVEVPNYIAMLDSVVPYMKDITEQFLSQLPCSIQEEINKRIQYLYDWVRNTQDEELYLFGKLKVRKEYMPEGTEYPARYYILESMKMMLDLYGVCSFDEIKETDRYTHPSGSAHIDAFDGPVTPHYSDLEFIKEYASRPVPDDPFPFKEQSKMEEKENLLYNLLLNLYWNDKPFKKDGKVGLMDCWGRVIVPAEYEDCDGIQTWNLHKLIKKESCIAIKRNGKWALTNRNQYRKLLSDYKFDNIKITFSGFYVTSLDGKYGLHNHHGKELLSPEMDDIYEPTFDGDIVYKKGTKYGIRLNGGKFTELLDELQLDCGYYLMVRIGDKWGYIDKNGSFVTKRCQAKIASISHLESVNKTYGVPEIKDIDNLPEDFMTLDDCLDELRRSFWRFAEKVNFKNSCLDGKAEISMGIDKKVLYYKLLPSGTTFCIDMQRPYKLKLLDDRFHDMLQSWEGFEKERDLLKQWLNEVNNMTGVRNWAEAANLFCISPHNKGRELKISYARRKTINMNEVNINNFEDINFPEIVFEN